MRRWAGLRGSAMGRVLAGPWGRRAGPGAGPGADRQARTGSWLAGSCWQGEALQSVRTQAHHRVCWKAHRTAHALFKQHRTVDCSAAHTAVTPQRGDGLNARGPATTRLAPGTTRAVAVRRLVRRDRPCSARSRLGYRRHDAQPGRNDCDEGQLSSGGPGSVQRRPLTDSHPHPLTDSLSHSLCHSLHRKERLGHNAHH